MFDYAILRTLPIAAFLALSTLACEASTSPASEGQGQPPHPSVTAPATQPSQLQTPVPLQPVAPTAPPIENRSTPTPVYSPMRFVPTVLPPIIAATAVRPTPTPDAMAVPDPTAPPAATAEPTAMAGPTPVPAPTEQAQATISVPGQEGSRQIVAQVAELGDALKWIAQFNNDLKTWSAFDPTSTFLEDKEQLPLPVNPPVGPLNTLIAGEVYWIGLNRNATLGGEQLLAGLNTIQWRNVLAPTPPPTPSATEAPTPAATAEPEPTPAETLEIARQLSELESILNWVAHWDTGNNTWWLYDPTGTFPGVRALVGGEEEPETGQLTVLEDGKDYLIDVGRSIKFRDWYLVVAQGSGTNQLKWVEP